MSFPSALSAQSQSGGGEPTQQEALEQAAANRVLNRTYFKTVNGGFLPLNATWVNAFTDTVVVCPGTTACTVAVTVSSQFGSVTGGQVARARVFVAGAGTLPRARHVGRMSMIKRFAHFRHALITLGVLFMASPAAPSAILPTYLNVGEPERAVVEAAISRWEDLLPGSRVFNVTIHTSYLGGTLAVASEFVEENGVPVGASITFDDGSGGIPWFIDETPFDDREFRGGRNPFHGDAGRSGPAAGAVDLLTVMQHELGHALGFSIFYPSFAARVVDAPDGNRTYLGSTVTARLTGAGGGTHTLPEEYPFDLMNPELLLGHRLNPSPLDLALLHDAFGYDVTPAQPVQPAQAVPEPPVVLLVGLAWLVGATRFLPLPGSRRRGGMTTRVCVLHTQGRPASARAHGFPGHHRRNAP